MRYFAKIKSNIITDLWAYDDDADASYYVHDSDCVEIHTDNMPEVGCVYINGECLPALPSGPNYKPLSRRQLRRGLLFLGIKSTDVEAKIAALPEDQREIALIDWQDASEYERSHPLVSMLGASFGLTDDQIDEAWLAAQEH